ncbi:unnamed protein product [Clonostachys rosea]|uniref:Uncharacterized protein n=1 Tax=Bionectria ochroleuca TaxID=29856 RepID=A0ABY6V0G8_BIOOC|nr:unnamed protein product [Clonostachys rosea]
MAVCRMDSEEVDGRWVGRQRREGAMLGFYSFDGRYSPSPGPGNTPLSLPIHRSRAMMGNASKRAAVGASAQHGVADSVMPGNDVLCCEAAHHITAGVRVLEQARRGHGSTVTT